MPTVTTNYFRQELATGNVNLSGDTFKVALMNGMVQQVTEYNLKASYSWYNDTDPIGAVSAYESSSVGYSAITLTAGNLYISSNTLCWGGTNISWSNITNSPYGICIYRPSDGLVIGFIDFGGKKEVVNGAITIEWNAGGIAQII